MGERAPAGSRRFRAVLFDVGGTLVEDRDYSAYAEIAEELGMLVAADAIAIAVRSVTAACDQANHWPSKPEYWGRVLAAATEGPVDPSVAERFASRVESLQRVAHLFSDVRRTLVRLAEEGRRLAVVSNVRSEETLRELLDSVGILHFFGATIAAGAEGYWKPDPTIFRRAAERLGVRPSEAFYVGDLAHTDAKGAAAAGLGAVWLNREGTGFGDDPPEITSLTELPRWIARLEAGRVI